MIRGHAQTASLAGDPQPQSPAASVSGIQHIVWVWFENREASAITPATAPYFASFAAANVNFTNFYGLTHPSQPNYLDGFSGSTQAVTGDGYCTFPAATDNLAKQFAAAGKSWRVYAQNFPGGCSDVTAVTGGVDGPGVPGQYVRKHNPAISFESVRLDSGQCANIQPLANFDPTVNFAMVVPNMTNDMHDGTTAQGDAFLQAFVPLVTASPDWAHTLLIVSFDEGTTSVNGGGHVYTAAAAPWLSHANVTTTYNHFNVLRTIEVVFGLPFLGGAATATTMTELLPATITPTPTPTPPPPTPTPTANPGTPMLPITYQIQLQVRADTGGTAFNLPNGSTFNSVTSNLNDAGNVAVKVNTVGLTVSPGLWFGGHGTGSLVYNANDTDALLSDPFLNQSNQASFPRFASANAADDGLYLYDNASGQTTHVTSGPLGATSYTNPEVNDNGLIGMRVKFNVPQALGTYNIATTNFTNYVTETSGNPNSPYSFLYAPAFNNNNRIAAQANLGAQPSTYKELRIWNPDGSSLLAASGDSSTGPVFFAMDNSISMNNLNRVAFTTRTSTAASTRRIVVADGTTTTMFPTVSDGAGFTSIDSFAPSINDSGLVAFRGNDNQATPRDSVFITNGTTFQRIAGVNDTLMTDTGPRVVAFLMGGVSINNSGEVAFGVQFSGGGNAIYVAYLTGTPTPTPAPTSTPTPTPACIPNPIVTTNADSGAGSLRQAIADVCPGGTITFDMTQVVSPITLTSGALVANKSVSINGPGLNQLTISAFRDSTNFSAVFVAGQASPGVVTLSGLTLSNGKSSQGGVINTGTGTLTIVDSTVRNNTGVALDGGGIHNSSSGTINIIRSTIADNSSGDCGAGVFNIGSGAVNISDSTLTNNSVGGNTFGRGGGICNEGMLSVINSTISGNTGGLGTHNLGGGIYNAGTMSLDLSTLTNNSAGGGGGGIYNAGSGQIRNSIVALNKPPIVGRDLFGTFTATYSFIGDPAGAFINGGTGNLNGDPQLGALANNGGPTQTHLLLPNSPAIDAGDPAFAPPPATDQRGFPRVAGPRLDMGAVEVAPNSTPTATPGATPTATPTASPSATPPSGPTATPSPTPNPSPSPTPTPTPATAQALNISTRLRVETGNNVVIGGFIISGNATKNVVVRGIGPSLTGFGISDALADPTLELRDSNGSVILPNDNWQDDSIQAAQLTALGLAPTNSKESALVVPLQPAAYTAILAGKNQGTGVGLVEIYDTNGAAAAELANISTRGFVRTGENVMIGGFILGGNSGTTRVVVRGIGPSLAQFGLSPVLADPTLELRDSNGATLVSNDNWQDDPASAVQLSATGFALSNPNESGIFTSLPPGQFTAILAGKNGGIGIGLIEIYNLR